MSNKKLSRLLEPNLKFYFAVMLLFAVAAIPVNWQLALAEGTLTVLLYFYFRQSNQKRRQGVLQYIDSVTGSVDTASKSTLINSPLPTLVFRPDTGEIIWSNESFLQLAGVREHLFEMRLSEAVPNFQVQWLLSGKQESPERVELNNHRFRVYGSLVRSRSHSLRGIFRVINTVDSFQSVRCSAGLCFCDCSEASDGSQNHCHDKNHGQNKTNTSGYIFHFTFLLFRDFFPFEKSIGKQVFQKCSFLKCLLF